MAQTVLCLSGAAGTMPQNISNGNRQLWLDVWIDPCEKKTVELSSLSKLGTKTERGGMPVQPWQRPQAAPIKLRHLVCMQQRSKFFHQESMLQAHDLGFNEISGKWDPGVTLVNANLSIRYFSLFLFPRNVDLRTYTTQHTTQLPVGRAANERNREPLLFLPSHPSTTVCSLETEQVSLLILNKLARFQALTKTAGDTADSLFLARTYLLLKTN